MEYVIGIDGGGTKTKAVVANMLGEIIAETTAGPTNPNAVSEKELLKTCEEIFGSLAASVNLHAITGVFAGMSGAGSEENKNILLEIMSKFVPRHVDIQIEPDTINALYSGTYGSPGIVQISGTGSITYGINRKQEHDRAGGWGYLFGDEGSGYDIGRKGIISALRAVDGRGPETLLLQMIYTYFKETNAQDLIRKLYSSPTPKNEIAPISKIVFDAYKKSDPLAKEILENAAEEIALSIKTLSKKLFLSNEQVKVVLCGGVFNDKEILSSIIRKKLEKHTNMTIILPEMPPVGGSIIGAFLMQNKQPDPNIIKNILNTI